jgi:hypothetical protein
MTYELVKQLKDAGFPYKETSIHDVIKVVDGKKERIVDGYIFPPTLSELIEACRDGQYGAFALFENKEKNYWVAEIINSIPSGPTPYQNELDVTQHGLAPEEAVGKLWLALNQKGE